MLKLVSLLNRFEVLPGVEQRAARERSADRKALPKIAQPRRMRGASEPRIIDLLYGVIFGVVIFVHDHLSAAGPLGSANFSATRIFALRARGLFLISWSPGIITFFVRTRKVPCRASS